MDGNWVVPRTRGGRGGERPWPLVARVERRWALARTLQNSRCPLENHSGRKEGRKDGWKEGQKGGRIKGRKDGRIKGRKNGRIKGQKDRRTEGRKDKRIKG